MTSLFALQCIIGFSSFITFPSIGFFPKDSRLELSCRSVKRQSQFSVRNGPLSMRFITWGRMGHTGYPLSLGIDLARLAAASKLTVTWCHCSTCGMESPFSFPSWGLHQEPFRRNPRNLPLFSKERRAEPATLWLPLVLQWPSSDSTDAQLTRRLRAESLGHWEIDIWGGGKKKSQALISFPVCRTHIPETVEAGPG